MALVRFLNSITESIDNNVCFYELAAISSNLKISDLFGGYLQLTSPPNIYFELQRTATTPNNQLRILVLSLNNDPAALSIRLLKIVNSAFSAFLHQSHRLSAQYP